MDDGLYKYTKYDKHIQNSINLSVGHSSPLTIEKYTKSPKL